MKKASLLFFLLAFVGFAAGLVHLFYLRFDSGDNYPPYSSLRADPLGTKALYESLEPLVETRRHLQTLSKLSDGRDTTLLWLGAEPLSLRFVPEEFQRIETFVRNGGRVVISLVPVQDSPRANRFVAGRPLTKRPTTITTNAPALRPGEEFADPRSISIRDRWNLTIDHAPLTQTPEGKMIPELAVLRDDGGSRLLPKSIPLHTAAHFANSDSWRTLYARIAGTNFYPVLVERTMGRGRIVLCADSFHFSNEALRSEREPGLLSWLIGPAREVVFEETHLGVSHEPGVAALARQYRLGGIFVALLLLAGLFIWRNSASFMPPHDEHLAQERGEFVEGKDSTSGFINLLKRNIPPGDLMKVCLEQWNAHGANVRQPSAAKLDAMQKLIDAENALKPKERNPVRMYREMASVLKGGAGGKRET